MWRTGRRTTSCKERFIAAARSRARLTRQPGGPRGGSVGAPPRCRAVPIRVTSVGGGLATISTPEATATVPAVLGEAVASLTSFAPVRAHAATVADRLRLLVDD